MGGQNHARAAESFNDWWSLAGLDSLVGETPAGWLDAAPPPANDRVARPVESPTANPVALPEALRRPEPAPPQRTEPAPIPEEWAAFRQWLRESPDVPGSQWDARRVLPEGEPGAPLMILTAWPEVDDQREGRLFAGAVGDLLDAMLRAIGRQRSDCYVASLAVTRPPGGRCDSRSAAELERLVWHHLRMAAPQRLLLVGSEATQMVAGLPIADTRGRTLDINLGGGMVPAVAVAHPALLLARPAQKAAAWDSLKLFTRDV